MSSMAERLTTSRGTAIALGVGAALVAGILLLVYLNSYRNSIAGENAPTTVLVAKALIPAGTSGTVIAGKDLYQAATLPAKEIKDGAIADPAYVNGRVAAIDILPGQQFTTADFSTATTDAVNTQITGAQRAISVSVDNVHGSLSELKAGDFIDLYVGLGARSNQVGAGGGQALVKLFRQNVLVLATPSGGTDPTISGGEDNSGNLVLRINKSKDAADFAYAADNTQLYFVIRPAAGAKLTAPDTATVSTVVGMR